MTTIGELAGGRLVVLAGDITEYSGDAIVNAANSSLLGGGGVDGAIHRAGGPAILAECRELRAGELREGLDAGKAVATGPGRLRVKAVIHTVGPVWRGGSSGEGLVLASCYRECLGIAAARGYAGIAFPAISTGVYGYPKEEAARVAFEAVSAFLAAHDGPEVVSLVFFSRSDAELFLRIAAAR